MKITIEEMLVERDIISRQQLERVKEIQKSHEDKSLTDMLLLLGYTTEDVIMNCFSDRDDMEIIHLEERTADPAAIEMLPESFIVNNEIVPVCFEKGGSFSCLRLSCRSGYFRGSGDNLRYDDPAGADTCRPDPEDAVGDGNYNRREEKSS